MKINKGQLVVARLILETKIFINPVFRGYDDVYPTGVSSLSGKVLDVINSGEHTVAVQLEGGGTWYSIGDDVGKIIVDHIK